MTSTTRTGTRRMRVTALGLTGLLACSQLAFAPAAPAAPAAGRDTLTGLFGLQSGRWSSGASGSYFRMLQPDGKTYLTNTSSAAGDKTSTLLSAGTDGGLRTGSYQATPNPAFAGNGDARSGKVTAPTDFFGVKFATATNKSDPQTARTTTLPVIYATGSKLSGNLSAFAASWNNQHFNQGAPKPDGSSPGFTRPVSGTYNARTRAYTLTWRSLIVGGPFNKFTGEWHLAGTFVPAKGKAKAKQSSSAPTKRTATRPSASVTRRAPTTPGTARASIAGTTPAARSTSGTPTPTRRTIPTARPGTPVGGSTAAFGTPAAIPADARSTERLAARNVADRTHNGGGGSPWFIGGVIVVVALFGFVAVRVLRARAARP